MQHPSTLIWLVYCIKSSRIKTVKLSLLLAIITEFNIDYIQAQTNSIVFTGGGTYNWNTLAWSAGHVPLISEDVTVSFNLTANGTAPVIINATSIAAKSLTVIGNWGGTGKKTLGIVLSAASTTTIANDLTIYGSGGEASVSNISEVYFVSDGIVSIGGTALIGTSGTNKASIGAASASPEYTFYGDVTFGKNAAAYPSGKYIFDAPGVQTFTKNNTTYPGSLETVQVGKINKPSLTIAGSKADGIYGGDLTINPGATLLLPSGAVFNQVIPASGNFYNAGTIKLSGTTGGLTGSNFPANFSAYNLIGTDAKEVYNASGASQTISLNGNKDYLEIDNTSGVKLGGNINVQTGLILTSGTLSLNNYLLSLDNASLTAAAGHLAGSGTSDLIVTGTTGGTVTLPLSANISLRNITVSGTRTLAMDGVHNINLYGTLAVSSGAAFDNGGESQVQNGGGSPGISVTGTFINRDKDNFTGTNGAIPGIVTTLNSGSTVNYARAGDQVINSRNDYYNLTFSNGGTKTVAGAIASIEGTVYITGASTIVDDGSHTFGDSLTNLSMDGGRYRVTSVGTKPDMRGIYSLTGGIVEFANTNATAQTIRNKSYQNIEVSGSNVGNSNGNITLNSGGTFTVKSGGIFSINANAIVGPVDTQALIIENGGIFKCGKAAGFSGAGAEVIRNDIETIVLQTGSTVEYTRTTAQMISARSDYYNLRISGGSTKTMNGNVKIAGQFNNDIGNTVEIKGYTLTAAGTIAGGGMLSDSGISNLVVGGTGGAVYFLPSANILRNLVINSGATLTLGNALQIVAGPAFGTIITNGTLNANGNLTLKSDAGGTAEIGESSGVVTGDVTVERYIPARRAWRFLSLPFSSSSQTINAAWQEGKVNTGLDCSQNQYIEKGYGTEITYTGNANGFDDNITVNPSIKIWNNNAWISPGSTYIPVNDYAAYCLFVRGDRTICLTEGTAAIPKTTVLRATGNLNETGSIISKQFNPVNVNYYIFAGNPYASSINLLTALNNSVNISKNKFWVWDPAYSGTYGVGGYVTYDNGLQAPQGSTYSGATVIQSGQAFMVQADTAGTAIINFKQTDKTTSETNVFGRLVPVKYPSVYTNLLAASGDSFALVDGVAAGFARGFSASTDGEDAAKLWNFDENISLVRDGKTLAIEFRPVPVLTDTLFFRLYLRKQPYGLQIFTRNLPADLPAQALLIDNYLNTRREINLYDTTIYSFVPNADTNSYRNRFMLVFNRVKHNRSVIVKKNDYEGNPGDTATGISIYPNPTSTRKVMLQFNNIEKGIYDINIYNSRGEKLMTRRVLYNGNNNIFLLNLNQLSNKGVYIISIMNENLKKIINLRLLNSE